MYCPKCGKENKDNAKFCAYCGAPLTAQSQAGPRPAGNGGSQKTKGNPVPVHKGQGSTGGSLSVNGITLGVLITLVGAVLTVISVFTPLYTLNFFGTKASYNYFGLKKFVEEVGYDSEGIGFYVLLGILLLVLSVVAALIRLKGRSKAGRIISIVLLVLSVLSLILCNSGTSDSYGIVSIGPSAILSLIGSIIMVVGNAMKD